MPLLALCLVGSADARANVSRAIGDLPVIDRFIPPEDPLSRDGKWTQLAWAAHPGRTVGNSAGGGWSSSQLLPAVNGAFWNQSTFRAGETGSAVAATLGANGVEADTYFSLWLDIPAPGGSEPAGYELRFALTATRDHYDVTLSKWQADARTVLASQPSHLMLRQTAFALVDEGGTVSAWTNTGFGYSPLLSASDDSFDEGYAGIEGTGMGTRILRFQAGSLDPDGQTGSARLTARYRLQSDRASDVTGAPDLVDLGPGNLFSPEVVGGITRPVLAFPRGGGLSLATTGLADRDNFSVAMLFRLTTVPGRRRILDFSNGTSSDGLYARDGRIDLFPAAGSAAAVLAGTYAQLVLTSASTPDGMRDIKIYVGGALAVSTRTPQQFRLSSGILRFFKAHTDISGEESAGAAACLMLFDGTLTSKDVGEMAAVPSRCEAPGWVPDPPERARARVTGPLRARPSGRSIVVKTGLEVRCVVSRAPCHASGRVDLAPKFKRAPSLEPGPPGEIAFTVPPGASRKVVVPLSPRAAHVLRRAGRLKVKVSTQIATSGGAHAEARRKGVIAAP